MNWFGLIFTLGALDELFYLLLFLAGILLEVVVIVVLYLLSYFYTLFFPSFLSSFSSYSSTLFTLFFKQYKLLAYIVTTLLVTCDTARFHSFARDTIQQIFFTLSATWHHNMSLVI